jgi:hypothetical protein
MLKILVIYSTFTAKSNWIDSLYSFEKYSDHQVYYYNARLFHLPNFVKAIEFDVIVFHTLFFNQRWSKCELLKTFSRVHAVKQMKAIKVVMPQDEFINGSIVNEFIREHHIDVILSPQPSEVWPIIYDTVDLSKVKMYPILTGYLDERRIRKFHNYTKPRFRKIDIGYRAAGKAPFWFGRHGYLKEKIAIEFISRSNQYGLNVDIHTSYLKSISGDKWYQFLASCRYTIGVEGGTSIIDPTGKIKQKTEDYCRKNPLATFEEVESECFPNIDGKFRGFAISPRHLEACMTGTCQILVEGYYNGILSPNIHYIPLKADFSNIDDVLYNLNNDEVRERIVKNCYEDIIISRKFTYQTFVTEFLLLIQNEFHLKSDIKVISIKQYLVYFSFILFEWSNMTLSWLNENLIFRMKKFKNLF